jgi:cell division protease FtsH
VWIGLLLVLYLGYSYFADETRGYVAQPTSVALAQLKDGNVTKATIDDKEQRLRLDLTNPVDGANQIYTSYPAASTDEIFNDVQAANISGGYNTEVTSESTLFSLLIYLIPVGLIILFLLWMMNNAQGGGNKVLSFGKSKAKLLTKDMPVTKFTDVAGADEAVQELDEIRDFLANPAKYQALGAKIPKGVLLYGPPGTGKTLLAKAAANESGANFYSSSASAFVEMFAGVGAARIRKLFEEARNNAPAIIFIDELDAVGTARSGGAHNREHDQTLNQLLVELDGFGSADEVVIMGASNRLQDLDPALLRPGRFDRQINVAAPDLHGRQEILDVHTRSKPLGADVDIPIIARRTAGLTGADLANIANEAAIFAARNDQQYIRQQDFEGAMERVLTGLQKRRVVTEKEKRILAYHEGGHALVAYLMGDVMPVQKVTIVGRGDALGLAYYLPVEDRYLHTKDELIDVMKVALAGRAAEEIVFGRVTNGAASDLEKVTQIARSMVFEFGMSDVAPSRTMRADNYALSEETKRMRDSEQARLTDHAYEEALRLLGKHRVTLDRLANGLLEKETIDRDEFLKMMGDLPRESSSAETVGTVRLLGSTPTTVENPSSLSTPSNL